MQSSLSPFFHIYSTGYLYFSYIKEPQLWLLYASITSDGDVCLFLSGHHICPDRNILTNMWWISMTFGAAVQDE